MAAHAYAGPWPRLRLTILERDGYCCQMRGPKCKGVATTVDHIVSVANGGAWHDPDNLRAACTTCNYSSGAAAGNRRRRERLTVPAPTSWRW